MVVSLGNVESSSFFLCKKKGVFRRSCYGLRVQVILLWVMLCRFYAMGGFWFSSFCKFVIVTVSFVLGVLFCSGYTCIYWAYIRCAFVSLGWVPHRLHLGVNISQWANPSWFLILRAGRPPIRGL
jgi:hypothetical protein